MKLRLRRPRDLAVALRDLARRRPREAEEYLDTHEEEWAALAEADPHDAADILEAIAGEAAADLITDLDPSGAAGVLEEMRDEVAAGLLGELEPARAADVVAELPADEAADIVEHLELERRAAIFDALPDDRRGDIVDLLQWPSDSAGGLMSARPATLPIGVTSGEAIEALRRLHEGLESLSYVYVLDEGERLVGVVSFRELVFARPLTPLEDVMVPNPVAVRPETDREEVAALIRRYVLLAIPVVDHRGVLLGIVTVDDAMEAVEREATEDIAAMVGAGVDETIFTPMWSSVRHRLPWIAVNLGIALVIALSITRFESIIEQFAVLAAYMPVVASVGGNGGAQSQAVIIRAMAVEGIPAHQVPRVLRANLSIGLINGLAVGLLSGSIAGLFTAQASIGVVIGLAALVNLVVASVVGTSIPLVLDRLGQDPALASNILLTMVTDLVGFAGFLLIATALL